jgi:hypothetical protein
MWGIFATCRTDKLKQTTKTNQFRNSLNYCNNSGMKSIILLSKKWMNGGEQRVVRIILLIMGIVTISP